MTLPVIPPQLRLALKLAPFVIIAILAGWLAIEKAGRRADAAVMISVKAQFDSVLAHIGRVRAAAGEIDQANARRVEHAQTQINQEKSRDLEAKLGAARRAAADYADRLRRAQGGGGAGQGGGGAAHLPGAAGAARPAAGAGGGAELDDLRICAEAVVKVQGWQDWWAAVAAIPR